VVIVTDFYTTGITNSTGKVKFVDSDGKVYDLDVKTTEGGIEKLNITNAAQDQILLGILTELKKINLHLSLMTDVTIRDTEVE
jgi:hypothetical protein